MHCPEQLYAFLIMHKLHHFRYNWLKSYWALGVLVGLVLSYFAPLILTGRVLSVAHILYNFWPWVAVYPEKAQPNYNLFGDIVDAHYPAIIFLKHWLAEGTLPLWNPHVAGGQPFLFSTYFFLYPINLLYLFLPVELAFTWHAMLRLLIAAIFTYLLADELKLPPVSCLLAALVFTFNGFHLAWLAWPHTSETILLPVILWLVFKALHQGQDRYLVALVFVTVILLAGGFLPIAGYVLYAAVGFGLFIVWDQYRSGAVSVRRLLTYTILIGLAVIVGILISAVYFIPFAENLLQSRYSVERAQDVTLYRNFHLPWWQIMLYLIPGYYGGIHTPYWGSVNLVETLGYVGILPLILALVSLGRLGLKSLRTPGYWYSLSLTLISLSVVYGFQPLSTLISLLPGFQLSINTRLLGVSAFGLALLAAYGLEFLQKLEVNQTQTKALIWVISVSVLVIGLTGLIEAYWLWSPHSPSDFNEGLSGVFGRYSAIKTTIYAALQQKNVPILVGAAMFGGQLLAGMVLFAIRSRFKHSYRITQSILVVLITIDLLGFAYWYLPIGRLSEAYPSIPSVQVMQAEPGRFLAVAGRVFFGNTSTVYQLDNALGHSIYHPARYTKYLASLDAKVWDRRTHGTQLIMGEHISDFESRLIDLLNVRYILDIPATIGDLTNQIVASQTESQIPVGEIYGTIQQGQTFTATADNLYQIDLFLATYARTNHQNVVFHLKDSPTSTNDLANLTIPASQIADNQWTSFSFTPVSNSVNHTFYFYLEAPSAQPGDAITIWSSSTDAYVEGRRYVNGLPAEGDLTFKALAKSYLPAKFKILRPGPDMLILENSAAMPRAYAVPHSLVLNNEKEILSQLQSPDFDPHQTVILEDVPPSPGSEAGFTFDPNRVEIIRYEPNRVDLQVNLPTSGWVVLTDLNYPGWTAEIDGQKEHLYQANYLFRAVPVPAGKYKVTFHFQPPSVIYGTTISLIALLGLALWSILRRWHWSKGSQ